MVEGGKQGRVWKMKWKDGALGHGTAEGDRRLHARL